MSNRPREQAEYERQQREKRMFLSVAGIGFAGSLLAAVALGHRRAYKTAQKAGEVIATNHVSWAFKAFGIGTLYAVTIVGGGALAFRFYLQQKYDITSIKDISAYLRGQTQQKIGGSIKDKLGWKESEDSEMLRRANRWLDRVDEEAGQKKSGFGRIKSLMGSLKDKGNEEEQPLSSEDKPMSLGARMRAACGFGKKS
ncbi:hypothetical protein IWW36_001336 [Coemansia brasiliensis]|uniref:Uncharacterized protein n=1 Tax=Coemansia brasiliensis TaxID=2650707 RepID=A0A9W8IE57_9FUNG|nr:hypothetical protein IWW36_001336 [Coemansia brasiliensis]